jgi:threonine dehydratase
MPNVTPLLKIDATREYGSEVVIHGDVYDEAYSKALELAESIATPCTSLRRLRRDLRSGHHRPRNLDELDNVDEILVPIGGGGLISGIALAVKAVRPEVKVIGSYRWAPCP